MRLRLAVRTLTPVEGLRNAVVDLQCQIHRAASQCCSLCQLHCPIVTGGKQETRRRRDFRKRYVAISTEDDEPLAAGRGRGLLREQFAILHRRLLAIVRDDEVCRRLI
jgi:hypothetical protein